MGIFYYVINLGLLLIFAIVYMKRYWTEEKFEDFSKGTKEEEKEG